MFFKINAGLKVLRVLFHIYRHQIAAGIILMCGIIISSLYAIFLPWLIALIIAIIILTRYGRWP